jgi:DNA repair protein RadC
MRSARQRHREGSDQFTLFPPTCPAASSAALRPDAIPIYKVTLVRDAQPRMPAPSLQHAAEAAALVRRYLDGVDRESFIVVLLDRKNRAIGINTVAVGSLTAAVVHPREVLKPAIVSNAAAILCAHNHPSGDPQPSAEDRAITTRLVKAGTLLGIEVLDHVIVGDGTEAYYSFADAGALEEPPAMDQRHRARQPVSGAPPLRPDGPVSVQQGPPEPYGTTRFMVP